MTAAAARRIQVCADDFGLTDAANNAILDLGACGAISATSVAVDGPSLGTAIEALRPLQGTMSVGLHLNFTENPHFAGPPRISGWIIAAWLRRLDRRALTDEIHRQLDRFETLLGKPPTHIDGHEHVHQFPGIREPLLQAVQDRYGRTTLIRCTWPRSYRGAKASLIGLLGAHALHAGVSKRGLRCNTDFAGVYDLQATEGYATRMDEWLGSIRDGGVIMCHPESRERHASPARLHEYEFLRSPEWPALLKTWNTELVGPDLG
jgi:predicted glycoside hydrolase/deacetylase ChbG (UPF0249 family)